MASNNIFRKLGNIMNIIYTQSLMDRIFKFIIRFPWLTILVTLLLTLLFGLQLKKVRLETDMNVYFPEGHPVIEYDELVREIFNFQESMAVAIFNDGPDGIFNPQTLAKIKRMTEEITQVQYVIAQRDEDVKSLSTMDNIIGTEDSIDVVPLMEDIPTTREEIEQLKENLYGNEMFVGWLVSEDGSTAVILAKIENGQEQETYAYEEIKKIIAREQGGGDRIYIAGRPVLEATFIKHMVRNLRVLLPMVIVLIAVLLYVLFGSLRGVFLPLLVVLAGVVWSMGIMGLMGIPAYDLTTMTPVILIAMGSADGIHILNRYYEETMANSSRDRDAIVLETMRAIWPPIVMTSLTTGIGFSSLLASSLLPVRCFGVFTALGIICALLFSLTFIPAGLMLVKVPDVGGTKGQKRNIGRIVQSHLDPVLGRMGYRVYRHRVGICICFALLALVSALGFIWLHANDSWVEMFPHKSDVYISDKLICEKMNGTISLNIIVEGDEADIIKSPSVLRKMDGLRKLAEESEQVGGVISIVEYIKRMNKAMNENSEEFNTIPDSKEAVAQYLLLYSLSGDPDDFDEVVDYNYRQANMTVMLKDDHTALIKGLTDRLNQYIEKHFKDEPVEVHITGFAYIAQLVIDLAVRGMLGSIILSILVIYVMTALMFRSFAGGLYNIIPITLAMLINFGLMGMLGITIGFANSVSFAIAMGIGVDYAIHLIFKFQREIGRTADPSEATAVTLQTSGKAILFNAAVVTVGFMLLLASSFTGHKIFGWLISLSMVTSFIGSVTLLPAALSMFKPSFVFQGKKDIPSH